MNLVLGFAPFLLFFVLSLLSADLALWAAFAAAFVVTIRDFVESPSLRMLDVGNLLIFGTLALVRGFLVPGMTMAALRCAAELALLLLLAGSIFRRRPFSLQYARLHPGENWPPALFLRVNYVISIIWTIVFAAITGTDAAVAFLSAPPLPAIGIDVASIAIAIAFTLRYPALAARKMRRPV